MNALDAIRASDAGIAQRRFHRFPIEGNVRLFSGNAMWTTRVIDISLAGVLLECPESWNGAIGNRYRLDLRLDGGVMIAMGVELARIVPGTELGFNRGKIDLASFTQLKRLIELNLGNHVALHDELAMLGD